MMGHNTDGIAGEKLLSLIQRIERLEEDRTNIGADIREVYSEAKGIGFDPKIIRQLVNLRKMEASDRQEQEALLESYAAAIGMLVGTPLGDAAMRTMRESPRIKSAVEGMLAPIKDGGSMSITTADGRGIKVSDDGHGNRTVESVGGDR